LQNNSEWLTVVGIAGDTSDWFRNEPIPTALVSYRQAPQNAMRLLIRTAGDPLQLVAPARERIRTLDIAEPIFEVKTMEQILFEERSGIQASARMMTTNAVIALILAITGIYAVTSYFVTQRTKEIGIRVALGAAIRDILKMTLMQAARLVVAGLAIGIPIAYVLMWAMSSILFNVIVVRWTTFSAMTLLLIVAAFVAGWFPAHRAARIEPIIALRDE